MTLSADDTCSLSDKTLLSRREDVDYGDFDSIMRDEAKDSMARAEETLAAVDALRSRLAAEL